MKWNYLPVIAALLIFFSCSGQEQLVLKVLTDQPEFIPAAEYFNSQQEQIRLIPLYEDYLTNEKIEALEADLLISKDLGSTYFHDALRPIEILKHWKEEIYPSLYNLQEEDGRVFALPLSFDVAVVLYRDDFFAAEEAPFLISPEKLNSWTEKSLKDGALQHLGFSPLWEKSYLRYVLQLNGENFVDEGIFSYDAEKIQPLLDEQKKWIEENLGDREKAFSTKYRYIPDIQLLKQGRLDFVCMGLQEFLSYQESIRDGLHFSYLSQHQKIRPDNIVYASITRKGARREEECLQVLDSLLDAEFQKDFLQWKNSLRDESFAFLGGLSSLRYMNQYVLPQIYKELDSRIFQPDQLFPIMETPPYWSAVSEEVVETWINLYMNGENSQNMQEFYNDWDLQFIP